MENKEEIIKITHTVTSPLNKEIFYNHIKSLLEDKIWNDLINDENEAIEVTISFKTINKSKED